MRLVADLSDTAAVGPFRLELGDSARFDARDPNTGDRVPAIYARHPLKGGLVTIERRADSLFALGVPHLPSEVAAGARAVQALSVVLRHPGAPGTAALRLNSVAVRCIDGTGAPLVPAPYLDRMQVLWKGALAATLADPPSSGSTMLVPLSGATLEPGDTARVTFVLDFETSAPATSFALALNASGLDASDANLGSAALPVVEDGGEFPLLSGITRITPPSRLLEVDLVDAMPAVIAPDGSQVFAATLRLKNGSSAGSAPIRVNHVIVESSGDSGPVAIGGAILCAALSLAGTPYGTSANLDSDSLTAFVPFASELSLAPGIPVDLELSFTTRTAPGVTKFALAFSASGIGVVQPGNPLLDAAVLPAAGRAFPLATASASYSSASLAGSWSNFPNPFSPAQGSTRFAFFLPAPARVTLEIWTCRGERVYRALDGEPLAAGLHQDISWDGRNGGGSAVQSGVYLAQLTVRFDDGRTERLRRAVAVVR
jgi:hypothetical protein